MPICARGKVELSHRNTTRSTQISKVSESLSAQPLIIAEGIISPVYEMVS